MKVVLGLGVLGTALAYPLYFKILEVAGSSNLMLVTIIVPVFAIILDAILLSQFVTGSDLFGFTLVAIGLFVMDGRLNYNLLKR
jgi:drug/metabolite transporter (DMT)-like permease